MREKGNIHMPHGPSWNFEVIDQHGPGGSADDAGGDIIEEARGFSDILDNGVYYQIPRDTIPMPSNSLSNLTV